jgi:hypothetical protein
MLRQAILAILAAVVLAQSHAALAQQRGLAEQAVESSTALVVLPRSVPSDISVTSCVECKASVLKVTETTRFFVGKRQVALKELREFVSRSQSTGLYVFFEAPSSTITRIVVEGQPPQR